MYNQKHISVGFIVCLNNNVKLHRFASDFDPMECLGSGAFGCVFKVRHKLLERFYAVKIVRREE